MVSDALDYIPPEKVWLKYNALSLVEAILLIGVKVCCTFKVVCINISRIIAF
jgi:hypothetical protein